MDATLISWHQWIIDTLEKKPAWLATQVIIAAAIADIIGSVLTWKGGIDAAFLGLTLVVCGGLVFLAKHEPAFKSLGQARFIRAILLTLTLCQVLIFFVAPQGKVALNTLSTLLMTSYYYFAACEAPRPKKRKQVVLRTA